MSYGSTIIDPATITPPVILESPETQGRTAAQENSEANKRLAEAEIEREIVKNSKGKEIS